MTIDEALKLIGDSKDDAAVKAYRESIIKDAVNDDFIKGYLVTDAGQKLVRSGQVPSIESRTADAIETYKKNHYANELKAAVDAEREKLNPKESPIEKEVRELREKDAKRDRELAQEKLMRSIAEEAATAKVPTFAFKHFGGGSIEAAREVMNDFQVWAKEVETKAKNEKMTSGPMPGSGITPKPSGAPLGGSLQDIERSIREGVKA